MRETPETLNPKPSVVRLIASHPNSVGRLLFAGLKALKGLKGLQGLKD